MHRWEIYAWYDVWHVVFHLPPLYGVQIYGLRLTARAFPQTLHRCRHYNNSVVGGGLLFLKLTNASFGLYYKAVWGLYLLASANSEERPIKAFQWQFLHLYA